MYQQFIQKINFYRTHKLAKNFSYLALIEMANYILPFITIPYIVQTIGIEKFGVIAFAYAIIAYFQLIVLFGFRLTGTKYISQNRNDREKVSAYYWTIISIQIALLLVSLSLFSTLFLIDSIQKEWLVFVFSFGLVIGNIIFPIWFFQGMEDMKYIAILNVISKSIYTLMIFIFVQTQNDYLLIPLFNVASIIFIGFMANIMIKYKYNIHFVLPSVSRIKSVLNENWHIFLSTITTNFYTTTNTVLLGFFTNYSIVGIYSIAETISGAVVKIIKIYNVTIYPHLAQYGENIPLLEKQAQKYFKIYVKVLIAMSLLTFAFSDIIIHILFGDAAKESSTILKLLAISILVEPLGGFFTSYLAIKNKYKTITKITFITMLTNFIFVIPLIVLFQGVGLAIARILTESVQVFLNIKNCKEILFQSPKESAL